MATQAHSIAKNTTFLTAAYVFQKILAFVYFTIVARLIGANDIGVYAFAVSLTTIFAVFIDFGLASVLTREAAKYKDKANEYLNNIISAKIILAVLAYLGVVITINLLGKPPISQIMVYIAGIVMIIDSFSLLFYAAFRAYQNLQYEAIGIAINQIVILAVGLVGILLKFPLYILVIALLAGSIFNCSYSLFLLKTKLKIKFRLAWNQEVLKTLFKIAVPFALAAIFVRIYSYTDQVLLSTLVGDKALGWYAVPYKITYAFQFIPAAFAAAIFPAMSNLFVCDKSKLKNVFEKSMFVLIVLSIPVAVGIAALADKIILKIYTAEFTPSILTLQIFIFAIIPMFLNYPAGAILNACDRQARNTFNLGLTMVLNVVLNIILIPQFSYVGAALAALTSLSALFILNLGQVPKIIKYDVKYLALKLIKTIFASAVMAGLILILKPHVNFIILVIFGGLVYLGIMYLIKGFGKEDIKYLTQSVLKKTAPSEEEILSS